MANLFGRWATLIHTPPEVYLIEFEPWWQNGGKRAQTSSHSEWNRGRMLWENLALGSDTLTFPWPCNCCSFILQVRIQSQWFSGSCRAREGLTWLLSVTPNTSAPSSWRLKSPFCCLPLSSGTHMPHPHHCPCCLWYVHHRLATHGVDLVKDSYCGGDQIYIVIHSFPPPLSGSISNAVQLGTDIGWGCCVAADEA